MGVRTRVSIIDFIIKKMRRAIAIVEDTDTASRNIAAGKYVLWKGVLTKASSAISSGTTLSSSNLTSLDDGAINDLDERINTINGNLVCMSFDTVTLPFKASHDGILWFFWRVDVSGTGRTYVQVTGALLDFFQTNGAYCNGFVPVKKGQEIGYIGSYGVLNGSLGITFVNFNN